jgi:hypothetical protein
MNARQQLLHDHWRPGANSGEMGYRCGRNDLEKIHSPNRKRELIQHQANSLGKQVIRLLLRQDNENTRLADPEEHEQALR